MNNRSLHQNRLRITYLALHLCCWGCAVAAMKIQAEEPALSPTLAVMTYNLRFASATPPNAWPQRRPLVREVITNQAPDVIGTQEG